MVLKWTETHAGQQFAFWMVIPLMSIIVASMLLFLFELKDLAWMVGTLGTAFLVIVVVPIYIVFFDSKKRWPDLTASQRFMRMMSCKR